MIKDQTVFKREMVSWDVLFNEEAKPRDRDANGNGLRETIQEGA